MTFVVAALYKFVALPDFEQLRDPLLNYCKQQGVIGTLLLAKEGINGTIAGSREGIDGILQYLRSDDRLSDLDVKESFDDNPPFLRMKVKLKREIVTMGVEDIDPNTCVGQYVEPQDWNALISDPDVLVIDTRNDYETAIGTFKGAVDPETKTFREFPAYVQSELKGEISSKKKVAMFCTGGIRCEKSTAYMKQQGFEDVYHLKGGILKYLEEVPAAESLWEGECFVFDSRVAVNQGLEKGQYDQCFGCRYPLSAEDMASPQYLKGVYCPHCFESQPAKTRARAAERQKQMELAKERGQAHMGSDAMQLNASTDISSSK